MSKVILIDFGVFQFRSIFSYVKQKQVPPTYIALSSIIACLKKIGVDKDDVVIIAKDLGKSWRREIDLHYKSDRKEYREKFDIDWKEMYRQFDWLIDKIDKATNFHIVQDWGLEADDWIAVATKYYKNKPVILCSYDRDFEQLCVRDNVKIFSPLSKKYKIVENPLAGLAKKINVERSDNLNAKVLSDEDYKRREMIVSLLNLPKWVENKVVFELENLPDKEFNLEELPFNGIRKRFMDIYKKDKIVTMEQSMKKKRKKRRKRG